MQNAQSFGFTQNEARYLARKPEVETSYALVWIVLLLVVLATLIHFTIEPAMPVAHAAEPIKTNADYCREWHEGMWNVVGATGGQMNKLCGEYLTK